MPDFCKSLWLLCLLHKVLCDVLISSTQLFMIFSVWAKYVKNILNETNWYKVVSFFKSDLASFSLKVWHFIKEKTSSRFVSNSHLLSWGFIQCLSNILSIIRSLKKCRIYFDFSPQKAGEVLSNEQLLNGGNNDIGLEKLKLTFVQLTI